MPSFIDLAGQTFTKLTVVSRAPNKGKHVIWHCECSCGNQAFVSSTHLRSSHTVSCGCYRSEKTRERRTIHGLKDHPLYSTWKNLKKRCLNPNNDNYKYYGGRGITLCKEWVNSFPNFLKDVGEKPSPEHTLDRIDTNKGYNPSNCKWSTREEQVNNTRKNLYITHNDATLTCAQWSRKLNINYGTLISRIRKGWTAHDALTRPVKKYN